MIEPESIDSVSEELVVINDLGQLAQQARDRYPHLRVRTTEDYLQGIVEVSKHNSRGLLVGVDPNARKLDAAVSGLRKAAGIGSRIVLCCRPGGEPLTRHVLEAGADDYLIYPPSGEELDQALGFPSVKELQIPSSQRQPVPSWDELSGLMDVLSELGCSKRQVLLRLCELIAQAMRAPFVRIMVENESAEIGDPKTEPALVEVIGSEDAPLGKILVGPRRRSPFSAAEVEKLRHHARLIQHLLGAMRQQQQWQELAMMDEVTNLPNRRQLMQSLEALIKRAAVERFSLTVVLFDLDGFKHFNDSYGHAAGDRVLQETAQLLRQHCRQQDIVARYAGDEFVIVFWDADEPRVAGSRHPTNAMDVLQRFREAVASRDFCELGDETRGRITISAGLATFPWDAQDARSLIAQADAAMLHAKRDGKNRVYLVGNEETASSPPQASQTDSSAE